ncbi:MAG: endolytic transglycosylase MltG [Patescibacteria group bacterium]|nr:endolytic transglycosylase MltG [Patescibacteria group bacterium]
MARQFASQRPWVRSRSFWTIVIILLCVAAFLYLLPLMFIWKEEIVLSQPPKPELFPVTVNPKTRTILEDPRVDAMLDTGDSKLSAAADNAQEALSMLASAITATPLYQLIAASDARLVVVDPGYRKEQAAAVFGKILEWSPTEQKVFLQSSSTPPIADGFISPGTYVVGFGATATNTRALIDERFQRDILSHYGTSTEALVPLSQTLTIASMLERETNDRNEMRIISGIMWNRIFAGMKLQIDATVQYAKASKTPPPAVRNWWPPLTSKDKYIKSPYNTYQNAGLPPSPIANPSVAAVLAALNPKKTSCLFYFHDKAGGFHCSDTYKEHVALLKRYYGQGK